MPSDKQKPLRELGSSSKPRRRDRNRRNRSQQHDADTAQSRKKKHHERRARREQRMSDMYRQLAKQRKLTLQAKARPAVPESIEALVVRVQSIWRGHAVRRKTLADVAGQRLRGL